MNLEQLNDRDGGVFKFVLVGTELRFGEMPWMEHIMMLKHGETATSAGSLYLLPDSWRFTEHNNSMTLKLGLTDEAEQLLRANIKRPYELR